MSNGVELDLRDILVSGKVHGDKSQDSVVHGSLIDGRFEGQLLADGEHLLIENAEKFHQLKKHDKRHRRSVVYRAADVRMAEAPERNRRKRRNAEHSKTVEQVSTCGWAHENVEFKHSSILGEHIRRPRDTLNGEEPTNILNPLSSPKVCGIFMQVDHLLYEKHYRETESDVSVEHLKVEYIYLFFHLSVVVCHCSSPNGLSGFRNQNRQWYLFNNNIFIR